MCPAAPHKNQTPCNEGSNTCYEGECKGSVCQAVNLSECQCQRDNLCTGAFCGHLYIPVYLHFFSGELSRKNIIWDFDHTTLTVHFMHLYHWWKLLIFTVCCLEGGMCRPSGSLLNQDIQLTYLMSGRSCNNYKGYCNSDHQCIQVHTGNSSLCSSTFDSTAADRSPCFAL